ncbi:MAG: Cof-type HAD-IIB family hydrolase [Tissierellia bacterium]|nr:Cof-type HAD-IIB family hydrolase [Tissierellia bacterium]MDD4781880.1 Cof-type HAD-IIB family hydrolase [Tissierellia bacterium]
MSYKYKMVVTDLDGTLLNDEKKISEKDIYTLNKLHDKGVKIVVATGRNYFMAKNLTQQIKNIDPIILANNGAIVRRSNTDEVIGYNYLKPDIFEKIYELGIEFGLYPVLHVDEYLNGYDMIYEKENFEETYLGYIKKDDIRAKHKDFNANILTNILAVCYLEEFEKLNEFYNEINKFNKGEFNSICNKNISKRALLEFLHVDGCKWRALEKYIKTLNIEPEEIISFGDDNNDIEMLKNSGVGVAMKNGTEEVLKAGKIISEYDNNNFGVSVELNKLFNI